MMHKHNLINSNRAGGKGMRHNINRKRLVAKQPNDVWVWDITYLYKDIEGEYFYLYAVMDLYSRKMMHWEVHTKQSDTLAAQFLENALKNNKIAVKGHLNSANITDDIIIRDSLVLHSDNGGPMKGQNMMAKAYALGLTTSYSRPRNSNDNAHIESSFATLKHSHSVPIPACFKSVSEAQSWVNKFYSWYNNEHLHSGIGYVTPEQCYNGDWQAIFENRNSIIEKSAIKTTKRYKLAPNVSLMSMAAKRKKVEKDTKNMEYSGKIPTVTTYDENRPKLV